jgi:hypothetical protein
MGDTFGDGLGEIEKMVLLAALRLGDSAYSASIIRELDSVTPRGVSRPSVYLALVRLKKKGLLSSTLGDPTPQRGGRPGACRIGNLRARLVFGDTADRGVRDSHGSWRKRRAACAACAWPVPAADRRRDRGRVERFVLSGPSDLLLSLWNTRAGSADIHRGSHGYPGRCDGGSF